MDGLISGVEVEVERKRYYGRKKINYAAVVVSGRSDSPVMSFPITRDRNAARA
jgi:hypothetical protein